MPRINKKTKKVLIKLLLIVVTLIIGYFFPNIQEDIDNAINQQAKSTISYKLSEIPEYQGKPYVVLNNNIPNFDEKDYTTKSFEKYSKLDAKLGRCGEAFANISQDIMPKDNEERESITSVIPSGWKQKKYEGIIEGNYLYNRCHLIGWQLTAENDNKQNLITGTRYMNTEGMLPFENKVAEYLKKKANKNNHVLYRVTPIFEGNNLVAKGVQIEAYSVEDNGKGICFNVYVYNVQPGIAIDYKTGDSWIEETNINIIKRSSNILELLFWCSHTKLK